MLHSLIQTSENSDTKVRMFMVLSVFCAVLFQYRYNVQNMYLTTYSPHLTIISLHIPYKSCCCSPNILVLMISSFLFFSFHGPSGSCLWSCLPLWSGSGMDSLCLPPQTLNIVESSRKGSSRSGPSARRWPVSLTEGPSRARNLTYSKDKADLLICVLCEGEK